MLIILLKCLIRPLFMLIHVDKFGVGVLVHFLCKELDRLFLLIPPTKWLLLPRRPRQQLILT